MGDVPSCVYLCMCFQVAAGVVDVVVKAGVPSDGIVRQRVVGLLSSLAVVLPNRQVSGSPHGASMIRVLSVRLSSLCVCLAGNVGRRCNPIHVGSGPWVQD